MVFGCLVVITDCASILAVKFFLVSHARYLVLSVMGTTAAKTTFFHGRCMMLAIFPL